MRLTPEALRELGAFAARGRLGAARPALPMLRLDVPERVERDRAFFIGWHVVAARLVTFTVASPGLPPREKPVPQQGREEVPGLAAGRHIVKLRAWPLRGIAAREGDRVFEKTAEIEAVIPRPTLDLLAPARVKLGEMLPVWWQTRDARQCWVSCDGEEREVPAEGNTIFAAHRGPRIDLSLRASGDGGMAEKSATVEVDIPPLTITAPERVEVEFGQDAIIEWCIAGAAEVVLEALDRAEAPIPVPAIGRIEFGPVTEPEGFCLIAIGFDGRVLRHTVELESEPPNLIRNAVNSRI